MTSGAPKDEALRERWTRGARGVLYESCSRCLLRWYFLRRFCPVCGSKEVQLASSSGRGKVVAVTVVHRAPDEEFRALLPYQLVLVDAEEGFRLMAHSAPNIKIGDEVQCELRQIGGRVLPFFSAVRE